jgi:MinD-like ATPase involved in chromosome partitioning or flagellar assembly
VNDPPRLADERSLDPVESTAPDRPVAFRRADLYRGRLDEHGRLLPETAAARLLFRLRQLLTSPAERAERELDRTLASAAGRIERSHHVAFVSPKGGVGKTTCTLLCGDVLARHAHLRCVAVDANPDYGTLGALAPDARRSQRSLADLLQANREPASPADLRPYTSTLDSGLQLLAAPPAAEAMAALTDEHYARLVELLDRFYEVILLDLGTGLTGPLARFALRRADQAVVVSTPEWVTADRVLGALADVHGRGVEGPLTLVLNQAPTRETVDRQLIEAAFRQADVARRVAIPSDPQLRQMLDAGALDLQALSRPTRVAIKQLGRAVSEGLA